MVKKLFSPIFLATSLLLLVYVFYKSEIIFLGTNRDHYFDYYILSLILIISSICTFYINKEIKEYLTIIILSIMFGAYSFEYYLSNFLIDKEKLRILEIKKNKYKDKTDKKWDDRSQLEVYRNLIKIDPILCLTFIQQN